MSSLEASLLTYLLNSLWQVPLLFATAWLAARLSRRAGPAFQHRLWVTALLAEVILPACSLQPASGLRTLQHWLASFAPNHHAPTAQVTVVMGDARSLEPGFHLAPALLATITLCYLGSILFFTTRLAVRFIRTVSLRRRTQPVTLAADVRQSYERYAQLFSVRNAHVETSPEIVGPVTLGVRYPILLLPSEFETTLASEDLDAALAHEFAHMSRRDFTKNLLYEALSVPTAFHPLLWLTLSRIAETRELLCDSLAAEVVAGRQRYARSLLRLASQFAQQPHPTPTHAIGIFDANHFQNFERRVMHLTHNSTELKGARRLATATICLALLTAACTSALAFRMQVATPTPEPTPQPAPAPQQVVLAVPRPATGEPAPSFLVDIPPSTAAPIEVTSPPSPQTGANTDTASLRTTIDDKVRSTVDATVRTALVSSVQTASDNPTARISGGVMAGNRLTGEPPVYPPDAKAAGIEGTVVLHAIIGKDGTITSLKLISGPDQLAQAAWDAVKQWTYKPYILNGEPTAVDTTITVNFSLQH
jgi:TonB family protein